jgi:uncharacterized membrane protein
MSRGETGGKQDAALVGLLHYGTWAASVVVAAGLLLQGIGGSQVPGVAVTTAGILMFILLPVCRVLLMLAAFVRERDYRFAAIAVLVLTVIAVSVWIGAARPRAAEPRPAARRVSPTPAPSGLPLRTGWTS